MNRANLSGLRAQRSSLKRTGQPKPPQLLQAQDPGAALAASINATAGLLHHINEILTGPMRNAPEFFKQYLRNAAKSTADCVKQLSTKLDGIPMLDSVTAASVDLLAVAAEHDPESAEVLANILSKHMYQSVGGVDAAVGAVMGADADIVSSKVDAELRADNGEVWLDIVGAGVVVGNGRARMSFRGTIPLDQLQVSIDEVEDARG